MKINLDIPIAAVAIGYAVTKANWLDVAGSVCTVLLFVTLFFLFFSLGIVKGFSNKIKAWKSTVFNVPLKDAAVLAEATRPGGFSEAAKWNVSVTSRDIHTNLYGLIKALVMAGLAVFNSWTWMAFASVSILLIGETLCHVIREMWNDCNSVQARIELSKRYAEGEAR